MTLGSVTYTDTQICSILNASAKGNGLLTLAHQLIAAKFNACAGSTCDGADIATADAFIGTKIIPPVGTASVKAGNLPAGLVTSLDNFNNGLGCALHCASNPSLRPAGTLQKIKWSTLKSHYRSSTDASGGAVRGTAHPQRWPQRDGRRQSQASARPLFDSESESRQIVTLVSVK
jgi:hypothetical protein